MNALTPVAGLTSGLLARKGSARPAMRPQLSVGLRAGEGAAPAPADLDDLGWNDLGEACELTGGGLEQEHSAHVAQYSTVGAPALQAFLAKRIQLASSDAMLAETPVESDDEAPLLRGAEHHASLAPSTLLALTPKAVGEERRAVTVRVTQDRFNQLREACNDLGWTGQRALSLALEQWLETRKAITCPRA